MNFWDVFQNLINLLVGRIYPLLSDNIFSFRFFLKLHDLVLKFSPLAIVVQNFPFILCSGGYYYCKT